MKDAVISDYEINDIRDDFGVDLDKAAIDAMHYVDGPWRKAYKGRISFDDGDSGFEQDRAAAFKAKLIEKLDKDLHERVLDVDDALILPGGGNRPVLTDPQAMILAFKQGGPLAGALGGGGGGGGGGGSAPVNINIYGGDQKKIYDTVMRALKALGHA